MLVINPWFNGLGTTIADCRLIYTQFIKESIGENELDQLRKITHKRGIFADRQFKDYIKNTIGNTTIKRMNKPKENETDLKKKRWV